MKIIIFNIIFLFLISCSSLSSGRYVQLNSNADLKPITEKFNVSEETIRLYNDDIRAGKWIFVPFKAGIMPNRSFFNGGYFSKGDFLWPLPQNKKITSFFGRRRGRNHQGLDITAPRGTGILAAREGKVLYSGWMRGYGRVVIINHDKKFHTVYAHTSQNLVKKGEFVQKGQKIAKVGSTGRSTGNHLHFEIRIKNKAIDPLVYFESSIIAKN